MKTVDMAEGRGPNPYYAGNFDGESDELRDLRLSLVAERDSLKAELARIKSLPPIAWEVYVADADHAYVVESLDDPQLIDDCTNSDAVVTPLIALGSKA